MPEGRLGAAQPLSEWTDLSQDSGLFNITRKVSGDLLGFPGFFSFCVRYRVLNPGVCYWPGCWMNAKAPSSTLDRRPPKSFATQWGQTDKRNETTVSARALPTILELVLKSDSCTSTDLPFCTLYSGMVLCVRVCVCVGCTLMCLRSCTLTRVLFPLMNPAAWQLRESRSGDK